MPVLSPPTGFSTRNPGAWLAMFGPGAIIASLTIGTGELVFSTRGGALFGYRLLFSFLLILTVKWALVFATSRHMVLTGVHPFQRWAELPGPRGWLPLVFLALAIGAFPIWVAFHAGTLGTLVAALTGTAGSLKQTAHLAWGAASVLAIWALALSGGYRRLERVQLFLVLLMLLCVSVSLLLLKPDWWQLLGGLLLPQPLHYPDWVGQVPEIASRPVWMEWTTYVGVVGGSGYDYLAYVAYLREKPWGQSALGPVDPRHLEEVAQVRAHPLRLWVRAPLLDCLASFAAVLVFSAVFVVGGALVLGPHHQVPEGGDLLTLQADFVAGASPWLRPLYFAGALLTMLGTLYGTVEVAPVTLGEALRALGLRREDGDARVRRWAISWVCLGGLVVLLFMSVLHAMKGEERSPGLVAMLTPANLFTGVLGCGIIAWLSIWTDWTRLPRALRPSWALLALNGLGGGFLLALGVKGYWDHSRWVALSILAGTVVTGWIAALGLRRFRPARRPLQDN